MRRLAQHISIPALMIVLTSCGFSQNEATIEQDVEDPIVNNQGVNWTMLDVNSPNMRSGYAMAYDTDQQKIIAYGGRTGFDDFDNINETWAFDYKSGLWENLEPANTPVWRSMHSMVYDPIGNRTLMFGGNDFNRAFNDLWEFDYGLNTWRELTPANSPDPRQMHGMVFNPDRGSVILVGGRRTNGGAHFDDTWEFVSSTNTWAKLDATNAPPVSDHINLAYYQSVQKMILFVGPDAYVLGNGQVRPPSTWAYDFSTRTWVDLNTPTLPQADHSSLTYDQHRDKLVLFGNSSTEDGMFTWEFDWTEANWTEITPDAFPDIYIEHDAMVYLADHNVFVQYGGCCSGATLELTIEK